MSVWGFRKKAKAPTEAGQAQKSKKTHKGAGDSSNKLWLQASSCAASTGRMADKPQACLSALPRGRIGTKAQATQTAAERAGSPDITDGTQTKRTVGDGFYA
jgi:hypothetical protein